VSHCCQLHQVGPLGPWHSKGGKQHLQCPLLRQRVLCCVDPAHIHLVMSRAVRAERPLNGQMASHCTERRACAK